MRIRLSIGIITYNRAALLDKCLQSLSRQDVVEDPWEIVVVTNNCEDGTQEVLVRHQSTLNNLRFFNESGQGTAFARNRVVKESRGEILAYFDDDGIVESNTVSTLLTTFANFDDRTVALGGKILPIYLCTPPFWFDDRFETRSWGDEPRFLTSSEALEGFSGSCMAFWRETLTQVNGFRTHLGMSGTKLRGGEESDLFQRIAHQANTTDGLFYYDPDLICHTHVQPDQMTLSYRLRRSYGFGISAADQRERKRTPTKKVLAILMPFVSLAREMPRMLADDQRALSSRFVAVFQQFAWNCGYYFH